ncbi:MAG TPA: hypothetical protein PKB10_05195 [Tepidisphaeraceae bacterium]|nr:hypothetical protein [Tepidisphaeraceae bacterium]
MATISYNDAKQLTSGSEFKIVQVSMDQRAGKMSAERVKELIGLARNLRDKAIAIARQQRREQRGKSAPRGQSSAEGNERSKQKVQLFIETLERLKAKAAAIGKRDKEAVKAKSHTSKKPQKPKKPAAAGKPRQPAAAKSSDAESKKPSKQPPLKEIIAAPKKSVGVATLANAGDRVQGRVKLNREQNRLALGGTKRIQGHVSGQTRRNQGKRDAKAAAAKR